MDQVHVIRHKVLSDHLTGGARSVCEDCSLLRVASDPRSQAANIRTLTTDGQPLDSLAL